LATSRDTLVGGAGNTIGTLEVCCAATRAGGDMGACPGVPTGHAKGAGHIPRCALVCGAHISVVTVCLGGAVVFNWHPVAGVGDAYCGGRLLRWAIACVHTAVGDRGVDTFVVCPACPAAYVATMAIVVVIATPRCPDVLASQCRKIAEIGGAGQTVVAVNVPCAFRRPDIGAISIDAGVGGGYVKIIAILVDGAASFDHPLRCAGVENAGGSAWSPITVLVSLTTSIKPIRHTGVVEAAISGT
jgi:hypothetical protein